MREQPVLRICAPLKEGQKIFGRLAAINNYATVVV